MGQPGDPVGAGCTLCVGMANRGQPQTALGHQCRARTDRAVSDLGGINHTSKRAVLTDGH